ncbi:PEP-CTERM sorting domain-containing protein [Scytonema sp. UIC 10036]|uniref:choice-of-anchor K domain-containing protein n=1 Tax=Scytonema sp. UIC 10036 TaxID=2304196 RepID=UPI0012DAE69E|nr:choice-of-anchor K domain-containing protein [Scytonema sp. UIC 10036]MUG91929.1 PEP-CTERM sorting domain-containing protein [Scytonema sp. UIC 10036]
MKLSSVLTTAVSTLTVGVVTVLGFSSQALGLTFFGDSRAIWGEPSNYSGSANTDPHYTGVGTNTFQWGDAYPEVPRYGTRANEMALKGISFTAEEGSVFKIGYLKYFNGTVPQGTNVDSVSLSLDLLFSEPFTFSESFKYELDLENTTNEGDPEKDADSVIVKNSFSDRSFSFGGNDYLLELIGFSQDGGNTTVKKFRVYENQDITAGIYARITRITPPKKVPEPASLVGLSVLSIYLLSRKNKIFWAKNKITSGDT